MTRNLASVSSRRRSTARALAVLASIGVLTSCSKPAPVTAPSTTVGRASVLGDPPGFVSSNGVIRLEPTTTTTTAVPAGHGVCSKAAPVPATGATTTIPAAATTTQPAPTTTTTTTTTAAPRRSTAASTTTTTTVPEGMPGEVVVVGGPSAVKVAASLARRLKPLAVRTDADSDVVRAIAVLKPKPNALVFVIDAAPPVSHTEYSGRLAAVCSLAEHLVWVANWRSDRDPWEGAVRSSGVDVLDLGERLERQPTWVGADEALTDLGAVAVAALLEPEARSPLR